MTGITKIKSGFDFVSGMIKDNKTLMIVPLKDDSVANILWNKNSVDCFIMKNDSMIGGRGATGPVKHVIRSLQEIIDKLQGQTSSDIEICKNTIKEYFKNIK